MWDTKVGVRVKQSNIILIYYKLGGLPGFAQDFCQLCLFVSLSFYLSQTYPNLKSACLLTFHLSPTPLFPDKKFLVAKAALSFLEISCYLDR